MDSDSRVSVMKDLNETRFHLYAYQLMEMYVSQRLEIMNIVIQISVNVRDF